MNGGRVKITILIWQFSVMRQPEQPNVQNMVMASAAIAGTTQQFTGTLTRCTGADGRYGYMTVANNATVTVDDSMDWRDRLCDVRILAQPNATSAPAGVTDMTMSPPSPQGFLSVAPVSPFVDSIQANQLWYSGLGWDGAAAVPNYAVQLIQINASATEALASATPRSIFVYADSATGALKCKNTDGGTRTIAFWFWITPPLGGRSTIL